MRINSRMLGVALAFPLLVGCAEYDNSSGSDAQSDSNAPMLFSITSGPEDPHSVTMALQLAGHALDDQRTVVLFFNVRGVRIPTVELPDTLAFGDMPIKAMLTSSNSHDDR